ncbi:hypothetical protein ACFGVS_09620 [Mucilaginibacter sp. AW1-7]|jgi:hypothetical protein|uniref:hypothetical protein n=1 Tax=Mucilaginibacter sp. AW1-7 TaxID=3349874 RepID=UPI003F73CA1E
MNPFILYPAGENLKDQSDKHTIAINEPPYSMNEGGEFLDDAIRMKDMPLFYSEKGVAARSSWNLL